MRARRTWAERVAYEDGGIGLSEIERRHEAEAGSQRLLDALLRYAERERRRAA